MKDYLKETYRRTRQYWYIDGLAELAFGGVCLLLGIYFILQAALPPESLLATLLDSSFVLIFIGGFLAANRAIETFKSRLTYPRTGYVSLPKNGPGKRWIGAGLAMLMAGLISALMAAAPASFAWMPAITGFLLGAVLLYLGYRVDLLRFYILAAVTVFLGSFLPIIGTGNIQGLGLFYTLTGIALFFSGGFTLRSYLQTTKQLSMNG